MNDDSLRSLWHVVRLAAEGSDWKRDAGESLAAWAERTLAKRHSEAVQRDAEHYQMSSTEREVMRKALRASAIGEKVPEGLIAALRSQKQCDIDGTECQVSRQAVDEAIDILERLAAAPTDKPDEAQTPRTDKFIAGVREMHRANNMSDFDHYFYMTGELAWCARQLEQALATERGFVSECQKALAVLRVEVESLHRFKNSVDEALNSGDGSYKP
jgi:hypothetical protein